jgi:hypothetical protein
MAKITKWQWRTGLLLAILFGFLNAGVGGLTGNWKTFVSVLCSSLITQLMSFLTKSPLDDVVDTTTITQTQQTTITSPHDPAASVEKKP